jgi:hypothetical protein
MRTTCGLCLGWLLVITSVGQAQTLPEFSRARPAIERKLRDPSPAVRSSALAELRTYPTVDAARVALRFSREPDASVRQAALVSLVQLRAEAKVRAWMVGGIRTDLTESNTILACALLADEAEPHDVLASLNKTLKAKPSQLATLFPAVADLGGWHDAGAVRVLRRLTELACFQRSLALQRRVAQALIDIRHTETVPVLIDLTAQLDGEVQALIGSHLNLITGERHGIDARAWQEWWRTNQATFRYPTPEAIAAARNQAEAGGASYYGIPIRAQRLVFVIDTSGSMAGPRLARAQKELVQAIEQLPTRAEFNIIVFNTTVSIWSPKPVPATDATKKRARALVASLFAKGQTCTYDALKAALDLRVESIYVLTDGEPTNGAIVRPDAILAAVQSQNRLVGSSIHVIGIAPGPDDGIFSRFLQALAAQNNGQYRKVE